MKIRIQTSTNSIPLKNNYIVYTETQNFPLPLFLNQLGYPKYYKFV